MGWVEWGLGGLVAAGAIPTLFAAGRLPRWVGWVYAGALAVAVGAQLWMIGPHWQVAPVYAAMAVLGMGVPVGGWRRVRGWVSLVLAMVGLVFCTVLPMFDLPRPTGPWAVGVRSEMVEDRSRGADGLPLPSGAAGGRPRRLPLRIWYPAMPGTGRGRARYTSAREVKRLFQYRSLIRTNAGVDAELPPGRFPVILFGPRWGGARVQDTFLAEELASWGYVVVAIDHPGNAALADTGDVVVAGHSGGAVTVGPGTTAASLEGAWAKELIVWTADDGAVLDDLAGRRGGDSLFAGMDLGRVGALGHSFGGASALALLGVDARVRCAVNLDGWTFGGLRKRTTEPVLLVYEYAGQLQRPTAVVDVEGELDRDDNAGVDASLARYGGTRAYVTGTQHMDFTDQTLVSPFPLLTFTGPMKGTRVREITRGMVVGFFDEKLKGKGSVPVYPEVKVESFAGTRK